MMPVIAQLEAAGYPVRKVHIMHERQLAQQYGVSSVPCFILVSNHQIVDRVVGATDSGRLLSMFQRAGFQPGAVAQRERQQAPAAQQPSQRQRPQPSRDGEVAAAPQDRPIGANRDGAAAQNVYQRAMAASVRIKIDEGGVHSFGTGTIVDAQGDEALVLTCGHVFSKGRTGAIAVDLFAGDASHVATVPGQMIHYDENRDVGLIAIRPGRKVEAMRVAGPEFRADAGMRVFSIGCDRGAAPSIRESRVTHLNRFLGPANIEVAGAPVDGRSGGGLFTSDGLLIGVCNAADTKLDEGLFAALETVHAELTAANLTFVYANPGHQLADKGRSPAQAAAPAAPTMSSAPALPQIDTNPLAVQPGAIATSQRELPASPQGKPLQPESAAPSPAADDLEVIMIVRSRLRPQAPAEVLFLDHPSRPVLDLIAAQRRQSTQPAALQAQAPARESALGAEPVIRGQN
jgi:hypothetical protein